jgi:hypothetical protein
MSVRQDERGERMRRRSVVTVLTLACWTANAIMAGSGAAAQRFNAPQGHVENVSFEQVTGGVINIFYDLVSDTPNAVFTIDVKASDDGGKTFNLKPSAITGDVADVKAGRRKKIVWRSGQDVAVLAFDQLKFDVVATSGPAGPRPGAEPGAPPAAAAPPPSGSNTKVIVGVAAGGAAIAALLLARKSSSPAIPPCTFTVTPTAINAAFGGESDNVTVSPSPSGCSPNSWTASASAGFVTVSPASGSGSGQVTLAIAANGTSAPRTATATIAGATVAVTQAAAPTCTAGASPSPVTVPSSGGQQGPVNVTMTPAGCAPNTWTVAATTNPGGFITNITPTSGSGNGTFTFTASQNTGAARSGTITVTNPNSSFPIPVIQNPPTCTYSVTVSAGHVALGGGTVTVTITNTQNCSWSATFNPNPTNMLKFNNMSSDGLTATGVGTTPLMVQVSALASGTRTGTVIVTDVATNTQKGSVNITQP